MKSGFPGLLVVAAVTLGGGAYLGLHARKARPQAVVAAIPEHEDPPRSAEEQQAGQMVTVAGPLANYMDRQQKPKAAEEGQSRPSQPASSDHIGLSPVGTNSVVLHKTFAVQSTVDFPFEIPAHAAMPRLHGNFQSFARQGDSGEQSGDVEFLVMDETQFLDSAAGRPAEALFSTDPSHTQDVNFSLPASRNQPVEYHLVFRNSPEGSAKKTVQADFTVDF